MSRKFNYEYVKNYINEKSNGECELLSNEYINSSTSITLKCKCGNIFQSTFEKLKKSQMICKDCLNKNFSEKYRLDIEYVKEYIKSKGCEYISGDYINQSSKLTIKCSCGNIFVKDFSHFKRGQNRCPNCGNKSTSISKLKYTKQEAIKILKNKGITLISDYIDSYHTINCMCNKGHKFSTKLQFVLYNKFGCLECSKDFHRGENANHFKGGESEVLDRLRKIIKQWKFDIAKKYNYRCYLTNAKQDCVVHHLIPFNIIVKNCLQELGLPLHRKIKDYSIEEMEKIEKLVLSKHTMGMGVLIQRKVHSKFHSLYGIANTTLNDFNEFIEKYYPNCKQLNIN